jgi:hypothetical protein
MRTILKLKGDGVRFALTLALLAACSLNMIFVAAFLAAHSDQGAASVTIRVSAGAARAADVQCLTLDRGSIAAAVPCDRPGLHLASLAAQGLGR